jgi:uncharacterized membrane protein (UPF0136 family)
MFETIVGIYIVLLVVGGSIGFKKAGSKVSLITALAFAAALAVTAFAGGAGGAKVAIALQVVLIGVFSARFAKTKKFMPAGLMAAVTLAAVILELLARPFPIT